MIDPGTEMGSAAAVRGALRAFMRANGITQRQLAARLGVTEKHVSQVFRGHIRLTFVMADAIAEAVGFELQFVLADRSPDRDCVFITVSGSTVTVGQTTGRRLHVAVNGEWAELPDRGRVSVDVTVSSDEGVGDVA